jgi:hypothetical protein
MVVRVLSESLSERCKAVIKSHSIKVLIGVLMLCCAPAVAQVAVGVHGGSLNADGAIVVAETSWVGLTARANQGDTIGILVVPIDPSGVVDESAVLLLMIDGASKTGNLTGSFVVPKGLAGMSFKVIAGALTVDGDLSFATATVVVV